METKIKVGIYNIYYIFLWIEMIFFNENANICSFVSRNFALER